MKKVCVVTGTRADYGLLYCLMDELQNAPDFQLQIIATGMHLSPEFGLTYRIVEQDGFTIDERVEMLLSSDTPVGVAKSIGLGIIGFADALHRLRPDILILLGDRYEILAAAQAALVARIPIAHLCGGDTTEGAFDEAIRHSITKMAHLHFVTNALATKRVKQLGEDPRHIYNVGSPGLDILKQITLLSKNDLEQQLGFKFTPHNLLITFHPVTLSHKSSASQFQELLDALDTFGSDFGLIFTKPNSDTDGRVLIQMIDEYVKERPNAKSFVSLGQLRYLSTIQFVNAVVGNSSSGLYEVPSFHKPTVNIGERQQGRLKAASVIDCDAYKDNITEAISKALMLDCSKTVNPYGDGNSTPKIMSILRDICDYRTLIKKHFYEMGC